MAPAASPYKQKATGSSPVPPIAGVGSLYLATNAPASTLNALS